MTNCINLVPLNTFRLLESFKLNFGTCVFQKAWHILQLNCGVESGRDNNFSELLSVT